jgi:predicted acylesterase/phospholipase RssA
MSKTSIIISRAILFCMLAVNIAVADQSKCYALALSSGQETAAYQAGVLSGLVSGLPADQVNYQAISGVAGGAANSVILSSFPSGQEQAAVDKMKDFWTTASTTTLYQNWFGGVAEGMFLKGGLYDSSPMKTFLES